MYLARAPLAPLNTLQDALLRSIWTRREQFRIFETLIGVLANGITVNPEVSKSIEDLSNDYIDLVIPGTKEAKRRKDKEFAAKTATALNDITALLMNHAEKTKNKNRQNTVKPL